ncbi:hypothetical protein ABKN59_010744 [Abortiporus biennis]
MKDSMKKVSISILVNPYDDVVPSSLNPSVRGLTHACMHMVNLRTTDLSLFEPLKLRGPRVDLLDPVKELGARRCDYLRPCRCSPFAGHAFMVRSMTKNTISSSSKVDSWETVKFGLGEATDQYCSFLDFIDSFNL